jgi:catechol 2,3-dioxygenase-like lactoylglutathione lyase family enzyme
MLDHAGFPVSDFDASCAFYDAALGPLGIVRVMEVNLGAGHRACAYAREGELPRFWFSTLGVSRGHLHVGFTARNRAEVAAFHTAAISTGGRDHGAPALRPEYHEHHFGAWVFDPDGNNIEAVAHDPE